MKKIKYIITYCFLTTALFAGHPLSTDDAFNVGKGSLEVEMLSEFYKTDNQRELSIPIGVSYGVFGNTDIVIGGSYNAAWDGSLSLKSFDDISLEVKHVLINDFLRIGLKPFITFPTGNAEKGFGKGKINYGGYLLITKEWEDFHLHTQFGYTRNNNIVNERTNIWEYSIAFEKILNEKLSTVFEFGLSRNCCYEPVQYTRFMLGGFVYQLNETITVDLGVMRGLSKSDADFGLLTGFTIGI